MQSPIKRLPKLLLVFWLCTLLGVVDFFVVIITHDISWVRFFKFVTTLFKGVSYVDSGGWGRVFLVLSSISPTFFLLLLSFLGGLSVIRGLSCHFLGRNRHGSLSF